MWWQHSRSAGVIVAPGRTHAMAGVMAHNRAIVNSANARILATLISILRFPTATEIHPCPVVGLEFALKGHDFHRLRKN